jgi:hypothetical protein
MNKLLAQSTHVTEANYTPITLLPLQTPRMMKEAGAATGILKTLPYNKQPTTLKTHVSTHFP